jgi:DNA-binding CsgD family transcriptional regulator
VVGVTSSSQARIIAKDAELLLDPSPDAARPEDRFGLTPREREILDLVAEGATNAHIASALGISPATVRKHLEHAYAKLEVSTRTAAVARTSTGDTLRRSPHEQPR